MRRGRRGNKTKRITFATQRQVEQNTEIERQDADDGYNDTSLGNYKQHMCPSALRYTLSVALRTLVLLARAATAGIPAAYAPAYSFSIPRRFLCFRVVVCLISRLSRSKNTGVP